ncbi:MAG: (Fe-S)-binding protein [Chloroflexi bacterium]|nr:(Fe-S)-binding protein [Chloroflexota bacterium]
MAAVALFDPCYMAALRPQDARHARHVLEALGDTVSLVDGRCCGQPAYNSGFRPEAKTAGRELLRAVRDHDTVVTLSGSCTAMARHYLPDLFPAHRGDAARAIGQRFREFGDYVASHPGLPMLGLRLRGLVAYHDACHARRELGISAAVLGLLARIEDLEVRRLRNEEECCGFGGTFSVKLPEVSAAMLRGKLDDIRESGARVLVSTDLSCLAHIESGARGSGMPLEAWTLPELLARALA